MASLWSLKTSKDTGCVRPRFPTVFLVTLHLAPVGTHSRRRTQRRLQLEKPVPTGYVRLKHRLMEACAVRTVVRTLVDPVRPCTSEGCIYRQQRVGRSNRRTRQRCKIATREVCNRGGGLTVLSTDQLIGVEQKASGESKPSPWLHNKTSESTHSYCR